MEKAIPSLIQNRSIQSALLPDVFARGFFCSAGRSGHVRDLQILNVHDAVVFSYLCRGLVKKISSAVGYIAVQSGNFSLCLSAVSASFLLSRKLSLKFCKFFLLLLEGVERFDEVTV